MHKHIDLNNFADGALLERVNMEIEKVLENIQDLNTDATKKRKVTITLDIEPNDRRELANVVSSVKSTLVPTTAVSASLMIGHDGRQVIGRELKSSMPGQYMVDVDSGEIVNDDGTKLEEPNTTAESTVIDFRKTK
ncbi:MAG: replication terminator protein [Exiguobacterium chiriqhucha]|uniref:replication terminator protein n=1 Tax=Exiguobacterium chiriqhucha TaxID=1385984 RepID=UPI00144F16FF|nr:replication terminator protein [Exiguobacterium chiriqhucha]KAB2860022.1 MAG: replication terminator protein [Exiguobacterium chiriqhucha]